jgi:enamine deaminase RidA (YjgF/YER057c/UK114 family)
MSKIMNDTSLEDDRKTPTQRLTELGLELPVAAKPSFDYIPVTRFGHIMYVSGQLPKQGGEVLITGRCGEGVSIEQAQHAAEICVLQGLACAADAAGGLDNISNVLRVTGFVASTHDFHDQPKVLDAASSLLRKIFGESGRHARSALGVASLPRKSPVEIEFIFSTKDPIAT